MRNAARPFAAAVAVLTLAACTSHTGGHRPEHHSSVPASAPSNPAAAPTATLRPPAATVTVHSATELADALAHAKPGAAIALADGDYVNGKGKRWQLAAKGTAAKPITLFGSHRAVLKADGPKSDYGIWVTGDYWHLIGVSVQNATKGIVVDRAVGVTIAGVDVGNVGEEGVHFRTCSGGGVLRDSTIHDTGLVKPRFGEGAYVGSAQSNWSKYRCNGEVDRTDHVTITDTVFRHVAAEGIDVKEGTQSGTILGNTFLDCGYSGENSADSAIDVKGNGWRIERNHVGPPTGKDLDGMQVHGVADGYGRDNTFTKNVIAGPWPGYGIGVYTKSVNHVSCDNVAAQAKKGLLSVNGQQARCPT